MTSSPASEIRTPPTSFWGITRKLGPGLIIAASIVGSGELIATTLTGAQAGFTLLWLIIIGCVIKVFAQVEIGRYALISGLPTLSALNQVPGPKIAKRGNWLVWYWFFMWFASVGQLGGIVGAVGQAMSISFPVTAQGKAYNLVQDLETKLLIQRAVQERAAAQPNRAAQNGAAPNGAEQGSAAEGALAKLRQLQADESTLAIARQEYQTKYPDPTSANGPKDKLSAPLDDRLWAIPFAVVTSILLIWGRFNAVLVIATFLVAAFTAITVGNVAVLQTLPDWSISWSDLAAGMSFRFPAGNDKESGLAIGLATIGIIGVGAAELVQYPYWCLEQGYAKWTGPNDGSPQWNERARGWMRVMQADAWASMVIYTIATIAFYLLGAAILNRCGLVPSGNNLIRTLAAMYAPVFSAAAPALFLIGAFAVLYSTFYVANASHARTFADGLGVLHLIADTPQARTRWVTILCGIFPLLCLAVYWWIPEPATLVKISGMVQAVMLPMLCGAALYFRFACCVPALRPALWWDICLGLSSLVMLGIGVWTFWTNLRGLLITLGIF